MVIAMGVSPSFSNIRYKAPTRDGESAFGMGRARDLARGSAVDKALALRIIAGGASCPSSTRTAARSTSKSTARKARPRSCCPIRWAPHCTCGMPRSRRLPSTFASCATTGAATAAPACRKAPITMECLGQDVLAVLDALGIERVNWCGLSMGGMVGQWLGAKAPERIERLVLTNTSTYFADKTMWNERLKLVREKGVAAFAAANMERWFTKGFRERSPKVVAWMQEIFAATPLERYLACAEAVRDMDQRELLPKIKAPTLVIAGKHDPATPPEANEYIKDHIPGARFAMLDAAHISNVEQAQAYTNAVLEFLLNRGQ